jgi:hypothetical protein
MNIIRHVTSARGYPVVIVARTEAGAAAIMAQLAAEAHSAPVRSGARPPHAPRATPKPLEETAILSREAVCGGCEHFLGGFKREQYRCLAKKGCTRLRIAAPHEHCEQQKWGS